MSRALLKAVGDRLDGTEVLTGNALEAQTTLIALLGRDISAGTDLGPSVLQGSFDDDVAFPQVTFRMSGGSPHPISGTESGLVMNSIIDLEVWSGDPSGTKIPDIFDLIVQLLDERRGVAEPMTLSTGYHLVTMDLMTELPLMHDTDRNIWVGGGRFRAIEQRWAQGS